MKHCEHCNSDFYSDTEYEMHESRLQMEKVLDLIRRTIDNQAELMAVLGRMSLHLRQMNILTSMRFNRVSMGEAQRWLLEEVDSWNVRLAERRAKGQA